jgi:hypothetical protein
MCVIEGYSPIGVNRNNKLGLEKDRGVNEDQED